MRPAVLLAPFAAFAVIAAIRRWRAPPAPPVAGRAAAPGPAPDVAGLVDPAVFAAFPGWVAKFEGMISTMYLDVIGLVTTGIGNLIDAKGLTATSDPPPRVFALPWLHPDGSPASSAEVRADWQRVKAMAPGLVAARYVTPAALHLAPGAIADLVSHVNASNVRILVKNFPDFPAYPPAAQTALLGMAWGLGPGFAPKWPTFSAAVRARDWRAAAANCKIKNANKTRNDAHRDLFLQAAEVA